MIRPGLFRCVPRPTPQAPTMKKERNQRRRNRRPLRACCLPQPQPPNREGTENAPFCLFLGRFPRFPGKPEELHPRNVWARNWAVLWISEKPNNHRGRRFPKWKPPTNRGNVADNANLPPRNIGRLNRGRYINISGLINGRRKECNCNTNCPAVSRFSVPLR